MKKLLGFTIAVLGLLTFAGQSQAQVISVEFNSTALGSGTLTAGAVPETIWNTDTSGQSGPYVGASSSSLSNLVDSTGTVTGVSESTINNGFYNQYHSLPFSNPGDADL